MKGARKYIVSIEETVAQDFEVISDTAERALAIAKEQYRQGILVLSPGEAQYRKMAVVNPDTYSDADLIEWNTF